MSKIIDIKKKSRPELCGTLIDPKARLDAWERARGAFSKKRMKEVLRNLRMVRKEWDRVAR